jgi:hypothetical protein
VIGDGHGGVIQGYGACTTARDECRCTSGSDCVSNVCAPMTNGTTPLAVDICVANDGGYYHGCAGTTTCATVGTCCVHGPNGSAFCAAACGPGTACTGGATCDSAYTVAFISSCSSTQETCSP